VKHCFVLFVCLIALTACGGDDGVIERFRVEGHGMSPTLEDGDEVEVLDYSGADPARGDIIEFAAPTSPHRLFVKRVIGLPGDTVEVDESTGEVSVGGQALSEPYVQGATSCSQTCTWTVPQPSSPEAQATRGSDRCYFVLGDNRQNSSDSRQGWLVPAENIRGFVEVQ